MKFTVGKLTKISDDVFEGKHPNFIYEGYVREGIVDGVPVVGEDFYIGSLRTTEVIEICSVTEEETIFKTKNSTYKLTDLKEQEWN